MFIMPIYFDQHKFIKNNPVQYFTNWIRKSSIPITISNI